MNELFTPSGVRLRRRIHREGALDWLLLPGGPGLGSDSLFELADTLDVPGDIWMVDLPGDGSNVGVPSRFDLWPGVLLEAAEMLPNPIYVGHSTGGMYLLSTPELEPRLAGLVLLSSAPDAGWRKPFYEMTLKHPLAEMDAATKRYEANRTNETLRDLAVASAAWNFRPSSLEAGRALLERMPYALPAVEWSDRNFDETYAATWWPAKLPTLIVSGAEDRIVLQSLWDNDRYRASNVLRRIIPNAAHFPWLENPDAVRDAFRELVNRLK